MAEGERRPNPNFGQRIIGSAKGLACSTFSGVAGIEAELKDPINNLSGGKRIAGPQTPGITPTADTSNLRERRGSGAATSSFRSRIGSERSSQRDAEFQQFEDRMEGLQTEESARPSYEAYLRGQKYEWDGDAFKRSRSPNEFSKRALLEDNSDFGSIPDSYDEELLRVQEAIERQFSFYQKAMPDQQRQAELSMMQKAWERSASKATQRLSQVEAHLAGNLQYRWQVDARLQPRSDHLPPPMDLFHNAAEQHHGQQLASEATLAQTQKDEDERILSGEWFHCPYEECHRRLAVQNSSLGLSIHQRCCVHKGCGYVSPNIPEWIDHCASEHHLPAEQPQMYHDPRQEASCKYCQGRNLDRGILPIDYRFITEDRCCCPSA